MSEHNNYTIIGPGVMGEAIIAGLIKEKDVPAQRITAAGPRLERLQELEQKWHIGTNQDNVAAIQKADVVILSVKPQKLPAVMSELHGKLPPQALVISIVAGATLQNLAIGLDHADVVRAMPNTPAQIGLGMTVWTATPDVVDAYVDRARTILSALGDELFVPDEKYVDMATALSGSGPAYVFLFVEALIDGAVGIGMPRSMAERLAVQTVRGSTEYLAKSGRHPAELRNMVTSPGGTTAAALHELEKGSLRTLVAEAIAAAYARTKTL